ncbi:MAG: hypoxanthine phosphoribosyltransferase [Haloarculaceae archaeon]|jgi:hypoxanthine phosphoribosyltransferase
MPSSPIDVRERPPYAVDQFCVKDEYAADLGHVLVPEGEIENRIERMAEEISLAYDRRAGTELYAVCVLKGAMRFFGTLTPRLDLDGAFSEGVIRASRYADGTGGEQTEIRLLDEETIEGRDILVVEDIIDEGYTLESILERLDEYDPNSVEVAVLFDKEARRKTDIDIEYTGFVIPDEFVVGYGLDYDERYRNVRHLAVVDGPVTEG